MPQGEIVPNVEKPFSTLTVEERDQVLTEIAGDQHYMALVSSAVQDDTARQMDALGKRIDREHVKLRADCSPPQLAFGECHSLLKFWERGRLNTLPDSLALEIST